LSTHKPSLGRVPVGGPNPPTWADISSKGVLTRRIADTALALDCAVIRDPSDLRSLPIPESGWTSGLDEIHRPHRVYWSPDLGYVGVDQEVLEITEAAVERLEASGTEVIRLDSVFDSDPVMSWLAEAMLSNLHVVQGLV